MTTRLLLVRHGHSHHQVRGVAGGPRGDTGLTDEGRAQVARLAARLARWPEARAARLYCSPLPRARETASILSESLGAAAAQEHCGLCSYHVLDEYDGRPHQDSWDAARRGGGVALFRPEHEGGDTWAHLAVRAGDALHEIAETEHERTALVVTHNETIQASLLALGYLPFFSRISVSLGHTSLTEWTTEDDTTAGGPPDWPFAAWHLARLNDCAHLEDWA